MNMGQLNINRFGISIGITGVLCFIACVIIMQTLGLEGTVRFFNSLFYGIDITSIIRMDVPLFEVLIGLVQTFVTGWLFGVSIAFFYNVQLSTR